MPQNLQKAKKGFKNRVVATFNAKLRQFLGTIFGRLYQIYIKMKNIPDIYWPGVFQYQDSNRTTDGSYTWISFIDYQPDTDYIKDTHT